MYNCRIFVICELLLSRFLFRSGNPEHPTDIFHDTTVEVHPEHYPENNIVGLPLLELKESVNQPSEGFLTVGQFDGEGLAQGTVPPAIGPVDVVRLHVHVQNPNWVILSEVSQFCLFLLINYSNLSTFF